MKHLQLYVKYNTAFSCLEGTRLGGLGKLQAEYEPAKCPERLQRLWSSSLRRIGTRISLIFLSFFNVVCLFVLRPSYFLRLKTKPKNKTAKLYLSNKCVWLFISLAVCFCLCIEHAIKGNNESQRIFEYSANGLQVVILYSQEDGSHQKKNPFGAQDPPQQCLRLFLRSSSLYCTSDQINALITHINICH